MVSRSRNQPPSKLAICMNRIDKYLDDEDNKWDNIYDELVNHNESVVDDDKFSEEHRSEAAEYLKELSKIKNFMDTDASSYMAKSFKIRILYDKESGPWHGNITILGQNNKGRTQTITLNHWAKGIGLIGFGEDTRGDVRCTGPVRKGLSLKDVMIYGLKWWASVDVIFARKYYSKHLWSASCHGLADTVGFHIAADYSRCPSVSQWWNAYKSDRAKKKGKST